VGTYTFTLPPRVAELHQWAAEGLAYTCYVSYVDQESGLGPDGLIMEPGEKWVDKIALWETGGREGGIPPGLREDGPRGRGERDYTHLSTRYHLRPEVRSFLKACTGSSNRGTLDGQTVESLYILWKTTGDVKWRERGYEIFQAIDRVSKTDFGYASIKEVDQIEPQKYDSMPRLVSQRSIRLDHS
jgi:mannosyl-oligosaccharide alpha-1,2-mannosidase